MNKKFELILLKNTLAIAIPAISVFAVLIAILIRYPIFDKLDCRVIDSTTLEGDTIENRLNKLYDDETYNVKLEVKDLYYSGFDYFVDKEKKGSYFYSISDGKLRVFLLSETENTDKIDSKTIKGKILKDTVSINHILNQLSQSNGMANLAETGFYSEYIISEPDYPTAYIRLVYLFYATPMIICGLILIYTVFVWINPKMHSQSRQLSVYGKVSTIIKHINKQLKQDEVYKKGNIYITSNYMIVNYLARTDIIKLDMVKYISKNRVEKNNSFRKNKKVYRLTLSDPDVLFYEVDFGTEELCDEILEYINGVKA